MRKIYFGNLSFPYVILPYHWGILRAYAELDPEIRSAYRFEDPLITVGYMGSPEQSTQKLEAELEKIEQPAVFASSNYVWNFQFHMRLARMIKEKYPDCLVVAGGPHIPDEPDGFFERYPHVDVLIHGEGEIPFRELLKEQLKPKPNLGTIPNATCNVHGKAVRTGVRGALPKELTEDVVPSPYLLGCFDPFVERLKRTMGVPIWTLWETNRGCPYACTFCEWGASVLNRLKRFDTDRLYRELEHIARLEIDHLYCADANFGILERDVGLGRAIVEHRARCGFPKFFTTNFAKNSNEFVFEISRGLAKYGMIKGTTLAMQSVESTVLEAIKRQTIGIANYQELKRRYDAAGIPTYVDLIVGLPNETRESFCKGMCKLLETGHHEDIRVFVLELLPNTPMLRDRAKYDLQTIKKKSFPFDVIPSTEVVYATSTMSQEDWKQCRIFSELIIAALHSGAYTRFLATFLYEQQMLSYEDFYIGLFEWVKGRPESLIARLITIYDAILSDFLDPTSKIDSVVFTFMAAHPEVKPMLEPYADVSKKRFFAPYEWAWVTFNGARAELYELIVRFLADAKKIPFASEQLEDLLRFQKDVILTPEYDPEHGKEARYLHNWPEYFFGSGVLRREPTSVRYHDVVMGPLGQTPLKKDSLKDFALAAVGNYFPDGKYNRFFHQPARMTWSCVGEPGAVVARRPEPRIEGDDTAAKKAARRKELKLRLLQ